MQEEKKKRLTVGYRARVKPTSSWASHGYGNHECILKERSSGNFSVIMLKEGKNVLLERKGGVVVDSCAWFDEEIDLEFVDDFIDINIKFLDWWEQAEEYQCPDCGHLNWDSEKDEHNMVHDEEELDWCCNKCNCAMM